MDKIVTSTGKEFPCSFFGVVAVAGILYADIKTGFLEAYQVFSDEKETSELTYKFESNGLQTERAVRGHTVFLGIENLLDKPNEVRISMQRPFA